MPAAVAALLVALAVERTWPTHLLGMLLVSLPLAVLGWSGPRTVAFAAWGLASAATAFAEWSGAGLLSSERTVAAALLFAAVALAADRLAARERILRLELAHLHERAFHDRLTDLPNRMLLLDRLAMAISQARRSQREVAVLALDLDGFKAVNDQHGHAAGDEVLRVVAARLTGCVRTTDTVARLGGDEFMVVLAQIDGPADAELVARKILRALAEPIQGRDGAQLRVGVSIGISTFPRHGAEIDRLLSRADAALYESKRRGKNTLTLHEDTQPALAAAEWFEFGERHHIGVPEIDRQHQHLVWLCNELNRAVQHGEAEDGIQRRFSELLLYTRFHFATEERYMAGTGYAGLEAHRRSHARLLGELGQFSARLQQGGELMALQTIKDWLLGHIDSDDMAMGRHLAASHP